MTLSTSRALSSASNSGFSTPARPTSASTAVPPRAGLGTVATGWHATSATSTMPATRSRRNDLLRMSRHPDVAQRAQKKRDRQHPRGPVDLPLQPAAGAVPAAQPVTAAADGAAEPGRLRRLEQNAGHQQDGQHDLDDDQRVLDLRHGLLVAGLDGLPVQGVEPGRDVVRTLVLVLQVVRVLPDVDAEDGRQVLHVRAVLVRIRLDRKLAPRVRQQPGPAAAELAHAGLLQLLLERVVAPKRALDRIAQPA